MLGSQTLGPAQLAPLTSMAGLFASSAPSSTPLAGARRPVADAQGARTGPATRERPAEASLRASPSFGSNSLRQRTAPAAAVEDDIDKLLEGLGDEVRGQPQVAQGARRSSKGDCRQLREHPPAAQGQGSNLGGKERPRCVARHKPHLTVDDMTPPSLPGGQWLAACVLSALAC